MGNVYVTNVATFPESRERVGIRKILHVSGLHRWSGNTLFWLFSQLKKDEVDNFHSRSVHVYVLMCMCTSACLCVSGEGKLTNWVMLTDLFFFFVCVWFNYMSTGFFLCLLYSLGTIFGKAYWFGKHLYRPTNKALQSFPTCILTGNSSWTLEWKVNILCYLKAEIPLTCDTKICFTSSNCTP